MGERTYASSASRTAAVREWIDTLGQADAAAARQVQRAIDASYALGIPTGEARELDAADLMPAERAALFGGVWLDTRPAERAL